MSRKAAGFGVIMQDVDKARRVGDYGDSNSSRLRNLLRVAKVRVIVREEPTDQGAWHGTRLKVLLLWHHTPAVLTSHASSLDASDVLGRQQSDCRPGYSRHS